MSPVTISHRSHRRPAWRPRHPYCRCRPSSITDHTRCRVRCPARRAGSARYVIHPMRHCADRLRTPSASVARPAGREPGCAGYRTARRLRRTTWRAVTSPRRSRSRFPRRRLHRACAGRRPGWPTTSWTNPAFSEQIQLPRCLWAATSCHRGHHHWSPELRAIEPPEAAAQ